VYFLGVLGASFLGVFGGSFLGVWPPSLYFLDELLSGDWSSDLFLFWPRPPVLRKN
jgi:hypothetical protein